MYRGKKIILRRFVEDDVDEILKYWNSPDILKWSGDFLPFSKSEEKEFIRQAAVKFNRRTDFIFAIETIDGGKLIGSCDLRNINWFSGSAELGIVIFNPDYQGKGYGKDALITLLNFGFFLLNLHSIHLNVYTYNQRAIRLYNSVGFKTGGKLREYRYYGGKYHDLILMDILKSEFSEKLDWAEIPQ